MIVTARTVITHVVAVLLGAVLVSLRPPNWLVAGAMVVSLLASIGAFYTAAWRQGHTGILFPWKWKGPFGLGGSALKANRIELSLATLALAFAAGTVGSLAWALSR